MAYYTREKIRRFPGQLNESARATAKRFTKTAGAKTTLFLAHSHKDQDIAEEAKLLLGAQGVQLWIDSQEAGFSLPTSPTTANKLKAKIRELGKLVLLATANALQSLWVPWELGLADGVTGASNVLIWPIAESEDGRWPGNEYVGIYRRLEEADDGTPGVFPPGQSHGISLAQWLRE